MAIRSNVGNIVEMKKNIYAAWCHVCSSEKNNFHVHCSKGPKSWCTYQCDIANGTKTHVPGKGLPSEVIKHVNEVFDELSDDNLLIKCLHGKPPDQNEAFNGTIWNRIPKSRFVGYKQFGMGVLDAVVHFNIGNLATLFIYDEMGMVFTQ